MNKPLYKLADEYLVIAKAMVDQELPDEVIADTPEEASAVHHIKMGWAPYKPMGEAAPCPQCGACFYPESSGVCPNCGPIC